MIEIPRRIARRVGWVLALVGLIAALFIAGAFVASHTEHVVSQEVKTNSRLPTSPDVYAGGMPYSAAVLTGDIPLLEVSSLDVEVPEFGLINASTTLRDISVRPGQVFSGDLDGAFVSTFSRSIQLDGVALGRLLGLDDLSLSNPEDISPGGGVSAEAEMTATLDGYSDPATVHATLRLVKDEFYLTPTEVVDKPEGASDEEVKKAFSYQLNTGRLPLPAPATVVRLQGGALTFETQRRNITLNTAQLSPIEIAGRYDDRGNENPGN